LTTIAQAINTKEQRAGLRSAPLRTMSVSFFVDAFTAAKIRNKLIELGKTEIVVPIFSEQFTCSNIGSLAGVQVINTTAGANCFNLVNVAGGLVLFDKTETYDPEVLEIESVTTSQIDLAGGSITNPVLATNALFCPAMQAYVSGYSETHETDGYMTINITFVEKRQWVTPQTAGALLLEDGAYLLLETGGNILLEA
jgi:hypothetical protein